MLDKVLLEFLTGGNFLALILLVWIAGRFFGFLKQVFSDYPPHRHVNGKIIYPHGYEPDKPQKLP